MAIATETFTGFRPEAIQFLADLTENNDRAWFQPRKADYEALLKRPLEAFCIALADRFAARGLPMVADPGRSPFRIYRDTRFAKDKSPYKTHVGASFPWREPGAAEGAEGGGDARSEPHGPGGYFHLAPGDVFVGGGMWHPPAERVVAWRTLVASRPDEVHAALEDARFVARFREIHGDRLTRVPKGFAPDHAEAELLKLKGFVFGQQLSDAEATSPDLPDIVADAFADAAPVFQLLARLP